jgi:hypothetical protein
MKQNRIALCALALAAGLGCAGGMTGGPPFTKPPEIIQRSSWTRRLPGGSFRFQTPSRVGLFVTGEQLASMDEVEAFLKEEEKHAWEKSGGSQVTYHFYVDGQGNLYEGRKLECEAAPVGQNEPDGLVWIAFLNKDLDLYLDKEAREKLVHLLAYLCFTYEISPDTFILECTAEAQVSRLCRDLGGILIREEVKLALEKTQKQLKKDPNAPMRIRTRRLRLHPSAD